MSSHPPNFTLHRRTASSSLLDALANHSPSGFSCESGGSSQRNDAPPPQQPSTSPTATAPRSACRLGVVTRHRPPEGLVAIDRFRVMDASRVPRRRRRRSLGRSQSGSRSVSRCASATGRGRRPECVDRGRGLCSSPLSVVVRRTIHRSGCLGQGHAVIATGSAGARIGTTQHRAPLSPARWIVRWGDALRTVGHRALASRNC